MNKKVVLLCGLPGSGKSTLANKIKSENNNSSICSADYYFIKDGVYTFNPNDLGKAHNECKRNYRLALQFRDELIIVDNTNLSWRDIKYYVLGAAFHEYELNIIEPDTPWKYDVEELFKRNVHGVSKDKIEQMLQKLTDLKTNIVKQLELFYTHVSVEDNKIICTQ